MTIPGKEIADALAEKLVSEVVHLTAEKTLPHLAVILVGEDKSSLSYINRKKKVGETLGCIVSVYRLTVQNTVEGLKTTVKILNDDPDIQGIIIQRPVPMPITKVELDSLVVKEKDVDGFRLDSPFTPPIGLAILSILEWVHEDIRSNRASELFNPNVNEFDSWLITQKILIIGKGDTGGKPIAEILRKRGVKAIIADSKTKLLGSSDEKINENTGKNNNRINPRNFNIVISCVGKPNILRHSMVSKKMILIGMGLHSEGNHLAPDYDQNEVKNTAAYYTPVPGGVGPVNVVCLFQNLIQATQTLKP
jgi:methylenetetrahydrofolate dehydrogenase (NADP+)/methenyltetrahydrofolate cyclohydrolase